MIVIICVDDKNGMLFNHRRQSKDKELRKFILRKTNGKRIWMNSYSMKQFEEEGYGNITVDEKFLQKAESCLLYTSQKNALILLKNSN